LTYPDLLVGFWSLWTRKGEKLPQTDFGAAPQITVVGFVATRSSTLYCGDTDFGIMVSLDFDGEILNNRDVAAEF